jgi:hypothetical protein
MRDPRLIMHRCKIIQGNRIVSKVVKVPHSKELHDKVINNNNNDVTNKVLADAKTQVQQQKIKKVRQRYHGTRGCACGK